MPSRRPFARYALSMAVTIMAASAVYLVGNGSVALWDRDEPRYAQASRQMLRSGDWVVVRFLDELRTKKPPFVYWCQASAMAWTENEVFAARLPSSVAVGLLPLIVAVAVARHAGPRRAAWTTLVLSTSLMVIFAAKVCLTDAVLLLWITIGQLALYAIYRATGVNRPWAPVVIFWSAAGLGALTKGTNLAVHAVTLIALAALDAGREPKGLKSPRNWLAAVGWWGRLRPLAGVPMFLAVVLPWHVLVYLREPQFLAGLLGNVGKHAAGSAEGHGGPPGYYLLTVWVFFLPWSVLLPMALVFAWKRRRLPTHRFALAGILGPWVFFELVRSKLPHYLLPAYPAMAFLTADAIVRCLRGQHDDLIRPQFIGAVRVWAVVVALFGAVPWVAVRWFPTIPKGATAALTATAVTYAAAVFALFRARRPAGGLAAMGVGTLVLCGVAFGVYLPRADYLRTSIHVAGVLKRHGTTGENQVVMLDYKEPSLAFYQGGTIREHSNTVITDRLLEMVPPWMVITRKVWEDGRSQDSARAKLEVVGSVTGLDVADGMRVVDVMVVRKKQERPEVNRIETASEENPTGG